MIAAAAAAELTTALAWRQHPHPAWDLTNTDDWYAKAYSPFLVCDDALLVALQVQCGHSCQQLRNLQTHHVRLASSKEFAEKTKRNEQNP
jgi:hypothetical protein